MVELVMLCCMADPVVSWAEQLEPVLRFLNASVGSADDPLASVAACRFWLADRGHPAPPAGRADHALLLDLRGALRRIVVPADEAAQRLSQVAARCRVTPRFEPGLGGRCDWRLTAPAGTNRYAADLLTIVLRSMADGSWARLRICPGLDCGLVFLDTTRAGLRTWCSMNRCGNRAKQARWRAHQARERC